MQYAFIQHTVSLLVSHWLQLEQQPLQYVVLDAWGAGRLLDAVAQRTIRRKWVSSTANELVTSDAAYTVYRIRNASVVVSRNHTTPLCLTARDDARNLCWSDHRNVKFWVDEDNLFCKSVTCSKHLIAK